MECKVLVVLGPAGSGKTTLARRIRQQLLPGKVAYLYNDDGRAIPGVDAAIEGAFDATEAFLSGCFSCEDSAQFISRLSVIMKGGEHDWLVIEPLGFVEGRELVDLLRGQGIKPRVISLLDVRNLERNEVIGTVPAQLASATVGIGLTKTPDGVTLESAELIGALAYVGRHAPGRDVFLLRKDEDLPPAQLRKLLYDGPQIRKPHQHDHSCCDHDHGHSHGHEHAHDHRQAHPSHTSAYRLKPSTTLDQVRKMFLAQGDNIYRIKGTVEGCWFDGIWGAWDDSRKVKVDDDPFLIVYSLRPLDPASLECLVETKKSELQSTWLRLRNGAVIETERTVAFLLEELPRLPREPLYDAGGPITHPEAHELVNSLRKRPDIPADLNAACIQARMDYMLAVCDVFTEDSPWWNAPRAAERKSNLVIGITWFAIHQPEVLGLECMARISSLKDRLKRMMVDGMNGYTVYAADTELAVVFVEEVKDALRFLGHDPSLDAAATHLIRLAQADGRSEIIKAWQQLASQ